MNFFKQFLAEMKQMINSKFILISGILLFAIICIVTPVLIIIDNNRNESYTHYNTIIVDGVEIPCNNNITWELDYLMNQQEWMYEQLTSQQSLKYAGDYVDELITYYSKYAIATMGEQDYRVNMCYTMVEKFKENFVLNLVDPNTTALTEFLENVMYDTSYIALLELSDEEKQEKLDENNKQLELYDKLMMENDFSVYVDMKKESYDIEIQNYQEQIELLEKSLIENPNQEDYVSSQIEDINFEIDDINNNIIPTLEYRLENNIIMDDGTWQDAAIEAKTDAISSIARIKRNTLTESQFKEDEWYSEKYDTYQDYLNVQDAEVLEQEFNLFVAESSLNSGKPDMQYVSDGARANAHNFISIALFIGVFAVLVGGCAISSEFQNGTVRLLMIRPRTRMQVLFSRFLAGLKLVYILYFSIFIVTMITNGFMYGFADYLYPNYTASGNVNFFALFFKELIIISFSLIFLYTLAFAISTMVRNSAVAIIIPTLAILGSFILMQMMTAFNSMDWIAYTPFLYVSMYDFFGNYSTLERLAENGMNISPVLGMINLSAYSAVLLGVSAFVFKKTDITN